MVIAMLILTELCVRTNQENKNSEKNATIWQFRSGSKNLAKVDLVLSLLINFPNLFASIYTNTIIIYNF